jgi:hypothetical protein
MNIRPRRNRKSAAIRAMVEETKLGTENLIYPIFIEDGKTYVYEAVQPVKMTLFEDWISHGKDSKYVVQRLKNSDKILTKEVIEKMKIY